MKIYISGKIAGDPDYKGKFARAAAQLERLGATVINPATAPEGLAKLDYMRICFAEMEAVDYVVFLPDWVESAGAKLERAWCDYVGVPTADWDNFRVDMLVRKSHGAHSASCWCWSIRTRWMHASSAGVRDARMNTDMSRETVLNVCARRTGIQRKACRRYAQSAGIASSRGARRCEMMNYKGVAGTCIDKMGCLG